MRGPQSSGGGAWKRSGMHRQDNFMVFGSIGTAVRQELVAAAIKARIDRDNKVFIGWRSFTLG